MDVWDVRRHRQVSKLQAPDATHFSWSPDGEHFATATCAPRLRVGNGYQVWHYANAAALVSADVDELWEVRWRPAPPGAFPQKPIRLAAAAEAPPTMAYRPPALRHLPAATATLHEEEEPAQKNPTKAALKNQRKRDAKKAARQENRPALDPACGSAPFDSASSQSEPSTGNPETDKKIKNIKKKLKAIDDLKEQQDSGKVLQKNQLDKIQKEAELLKELRELQL